MKVNLRLCQMYEYKSINTTTQHFDIFA